MSNDWITAEELMKQLDNDPEYQRGLAEKNEKLQRGWDAIKSDERELVAELREAGYDVESVWDFVNTNDPYLNAIPTLLRHLGIDHHKRIREGITRALITRDARGVADRQLIDLFKSLPVSENEYKWVLALAIAETATSDTVHEVVELARNKEHGIARRELLHAVRGGRMNPNVAAATLVDFLDDPETQEDAQRILQHFHDDCE